MGFIPQNWVDCLEVTYETISLNEAATLTVIKEVIKLYSYLKTAVSVNNVNDLPQNPLIYVGRTDVRAKWLQHFHFKFS